MKRPAYRNTPRGLGGLSVDVRREMKEFDLDEMALLGNRAQRRWALDLLKKMNRQEQINGRR